jgi:RimJ/RimL family protein N-acetyltransferase
MLPIGGDPADGEARFRTERLVVVRRWRAVDLDGYAALNADPEVMLHLGAPMTREQSDSLARYGEGWAERAGLGLLPVVRADGWDPDEGGELLGMCGLHRQRWYPDEVEVGWRFARHAWGKGYATEAAGRWLDEAFGSLGLDHVISITHPENLRSQAVMRRLGLQPRERAIKPAADGSPLPVIVFTTTSQEWHRRSR